MTTDQYYDLIDMLEMEIDWSYVESECKGTQRFDLGQRSIWVYESGEIAGLPTLPVSVQNTVKNIIKELDLAITL